MFGDFFTDTSSSEDEYSSDEAEVMELLPGSKGDGLNPRRSSSTRHGVGSETPLNRKLKAMEAGEIGGPTSVPEKERLRFDPSQFDPGKKKLEIIVISVRNGSLKLKHVSVKTNSAQMHLDADIFN